MTTILAIICVCIASLVILHHQLYYHFRRVDKGKLYRCGKLSQLAFRLITKTHKIKTVINLIEDAEYNKQWFLQQQSFCHNNGINYFPIPIHCPPNLNQIQQLIDIFDTIDNYPTLIHCKQGVLRTGLVVAIYQKNYCNMDNETILTRMPNFRHDFHGKRYHFFRQFILNYSPNKNSDTLATDIPTMPPFSGHRADAQDDS